MRGGEGGVRPARLAFAVLLAVLCAAPSAGAVELGKGIGKGDFKQPALFSADQVTHYRDLGQIVAKGNVEVVQGTQTLLADTLAYNERDNAITAKGNVVLHKENGDVLFADYIEVSGDFRDSLARNIRILLADQSRMAGNAARRIDGRDTYIYKGVYSPCKPCADNPGRSLVWQVKAAEVHHDEVQKRVEYKDATLEFAGVPVVYTPYLSHADPSRKRESGFLTPSIGNSSRMGLIVKTPYYYNIAPDKDLTLNPHLYPAEKQLLLAGEYRQRTRAGEYKMAASGTAEWDENGAGGRKSNQREFRGHLKGDGKFDIDNTWRWGYDVARSTDDTYTRRYGFGADPTLTSRGFAEGFRNRNYVAANAYSFQNQRNDRSDDIVPWIATSVQHNHMGEPGKAGAYLTLDSSLLSIQRSDGLDTNRLATRAAWHLPHVASNGLITELTAALDVDGYHVSDHKHPLDARQRYEGFAGRAFPQAAIKWRYPMARSHGTTTEVLEPIAAVVVAPNSGNNWRIPNEDSQDFEFNDSSLFNMNRFTGIDRVEGGQRVDYGLKWGAFGAKGGRTQIFAGQSYRAREDDTFNPRSGADGHLSDFVGRVNVAPSGFLDFLYRFRIDKENFDLMVSESGVKVGPSALKLDVRHIMVSHNSDVGSFGDREELYTGIQTRLTQYWSGNIFALQRLSHPEGLQATGLQLKYNDECFAVIGSYDHRNFQDRDIKSDDTFMIRLVFKTLGETTFN